MHTTADESPTAHLISVWLKGLHRLSRAGTSAALVDQALVSGANFVTNILLARTFGIRDYGVFTLAWMAVLFVNSLQYALIVAPMMSVGPKQDGEERPSYFGSVLLHESFFAPLAALVMLIAVLLSTRYFPHWKVGDIGIPLSAATLGYLGQDFIRRYFFCVGKRKLALASDGISYLLQIPVLFCLGVWHLLTVSSALWIITATSFLGIILLANRYEAIRFHARSLRDVTNRHWDIGRWLVSSCMMQWGSGNLFVILAPVYFGAAASAVLRASQNIVGVTNIWFLGLDNVLPAQASKQMHNDGLDGMLRYVKRVAVQWGGVTLLITGLIALFPDLLLKLAYGSKYASYGYALRLYALLYFITFFAGPLRAGLLALEYTAPIFWAYPLTIAFSVGLAWPFTRQLGLQGVILGICGTQAISQSVMGTALVFKIRRLRRQVQAETVAGAVPEVS